MYPMYVCMYGIWYVCTVYGQVMAWYGMVWYGMVWYDKHLGVTLEGEEEEEEINYWEEISSFLLLLLLLLLLHHLY